jgi:membrane protein
MIVSFAVVTLLFALIYRFIPDVRLGWSNVWAGAVITALLFSLGKAVIGA